MPENVLVIGSGGREHALLWKLTQSPRKPNLFVAPGNGGTGKIAQNVPIAIADIPALVRFAKAYAIDLTVVGPETALAGGIVDEFRYHNLRIFGPTYRAVKVETSKARAKRFMKKHNIPTAPFRIFEDPSKALTEVYSRALPLVIKADGLAGGKGVRICKTRDDAREAIREIMIVSKLKGAGKTVIIEDFLQGQELSIHAFANGETFRLFPPSQDHKTLFDGDEGPMTGGMGAYAPVPWVTDYMLAQIQEKIVRPALMDLSDQGSPFSGVLYPGLKITPEGPMVLEFNARLGDPETQVYMRLLKTDLLDIIDACLAGSLEHILIEWHKGYAVCIVLASAGYGYSDYFEIDIPIEGIDEAEKIPGVVVFHAGTARDRNTLVTAGGRVLGVSAMADTLDHTLVRAYEAARLTQFDGMHYRHKIGAQAFIV